MPEPSSPPGVDRCLAGLCAALEAARSETPERVLAGFLEATWVELAAWLELRDGVAGVRAVTRDRRSAVDGELRLPDTWRGELAGGRLVRGDSSELGRTALRLPTGAVLIAPIPVRDGSPTAAILLAVDLAHGPWSLGQEQALRGLASGLAGWHNARHLQQIVDHLPQRIAWKDPGLRYRGANRAFTRAAGLSVPQLLGRIDADLPLRAASSALDETTRRREHQALSTPLLRHPEVTALPGGREAWFEVSKIPLADGGLLLVRDEISARVQLTRQLQRARNIAAIGRLAAGVGDELGPIARELTGAVAAASHDPTALTRIERSARALDDLVRQLATFARRQLHEPVDLVPAQVLTNMHPTLARVLGDGVRLDLAPASLRCAVRVDPRLFELLLVSSLTHVRARLGGRGRVALEVGPVSLDLERAAELALPAGEYVRLRAAAEALAGVHEAADLRLPLARTVAAQAGGGLHIVTTASGLRLELYLPRVFTMPRPQEPGPVIDLRGAERLLLIEDDPLLAQTLGAVLRHLGYDVQVTDDITAALDLLQETCPPDHVPEARVSLALLSTTLPAPADAIRRLRAACPDMRVLWLASAPGPAGVASDPLVVPCTFEALALRVRQALEARVS